MNKNGLAEIVLCVAAPALAASLPDIDVEINCTEVAKQLGGGAQAVILTCLKQEQDSYNKLKSRWATLPVLV